jgi:acyl-coenzyme A thioesterase PaaI-like protein
MSTPLLSLYNRLQRWPAGTWLFSRAVCFKAPYFASIAPRITRLENGRCEGTLVDRRRVRNHIGTVHAIAMCNLAELTAGLMVDASLPKGMRWIPKGMSVEYLAKVKSDIRAVADGSNIDWAQAGDQVVPVDVFDTEGKKVFAARITMNVKAA